jgi:menaquinone-specific isochorismate synthase
VRLGRQSAPLAFLTAPPLGGEAQIRTPAVLLRRAGADLSLQLSGRRDASSPALVAHGWRTNLASILSRPLRGVGGRIVERRFSPDRDAWTSRVLVATRAIKAGRFDKVVLARRLDVALDRAIDPLWLARALVRAAPEGRIFKLKLGAGALVAASPELLAVKRGMRVTSHALAGTAPYLGDAPADWRAEQNLFASPKERREHQLVVASIAEGMRGICDDVAHAPTPGLMRLRRLCHLWTPVTGRLRPGFDLFDLLAILHPTPAVLGFPRAAARAFLHEIEESRDSLYTGLAGWIDGDGDGDAAVVLRSAYLEGAQARLWAGAGIMAESDPEAEWAETELKMSGLLDLLEPPI